MSNRKKPVARLNWTGTSLGLFATKGTYDGKSLDLGWKKIAIEDIVRAAEGLPKIIFIETKSGEVIFAEVTRDSMKHDLVMAINKDASRLITDNEKIEYENAGLTFRSETCPYCTSALPLSKFGKSPQLYCFYCETVFRETRNLKDEETLRLCSRCGFFSKPEFFQYMLIWCIVFAFGIQERKRIICKSCEQEKARKACLINSLFLVGIPCALSARCTANQAQDLPPRYFDLNTANSLARKHDKEQVEKAIRLYRNILVSNPVDVGIRFNIGRAYLLMGDWHHASEELERALENCSNYKPAAELLLFSYEKMGHHEERIIQLKKTFDFQDDEEAI